jgi:hypothetical protein
MGKASTLSPKESMFGISTGHIHPFKTGLANTFDGGKVYVENDSGKVAGSPIIMVVSLYRNFRRRVLTFQLDRQDA